MRKKGSEIRLLNAGVNADDSVQLIGENELINALNVTPYSPYRQNEGSISSLFPPQAVTSIQTILTTDGGTHTLLGYCSDAKQNTIYLFFWQNAGLHKIISLFNATTATIILRNSYVVGGLGWTSDMFISARTFGNLLFFTDNVNPQRYVNVLKSYGVGSLTQAMLSIGQEPYAAPLKVSRVTDATETSFEAQLGTFQFCYRIQNEEGFTSVLSPYSETVTAVRQTDIDSTANFGNTIKAELNFGVIIPSNWKRIDYVVRYVAGNTFFVFKSFFINNATDAAAVTAHNSGVTPLTSIFSGITLESVDTNSAVKPFESLPILSKHLEVALNRIILGNNLLGYDTPTVAPPNLSVSTTTINSVLPTGTFRPVYLVLAKNFDLDDADFPIYGGLFTSFDSKVFSIPLEYSKLRFNGSTTLFASTKEPAFPYNPPQIISREALIEVPTAFDGTLAAAFPDRFAYLDTLANPLNNGFNLDDGIYCYNQELAKLVWSVHGIGNLVDNSGTVTSGNWYAVTTPTATGYVGLSRFKMYSGSQYSVYVTDEPTATAPGGSRSYLPRANYNYGVRFYDEMMRSCGDQNLGKIEIPAYDPFNRTLLDKVQFSLTGTTGGAPAWAKYFALTMSKNDICQDFLMFAPNCIKVARQDEDGVKYVTSDWSNNLLNDKLYGIAVPLDALGQYNKGYSFDKASSIYDRMTLSFAVGSPTLYTDDFEYTGNIIDVIDGHVIIAPPSDRKLANITGYLSTQYKQIASPTYNGLLAAAESNFIPYSGYIYQRQHVCFATIYVGKNPSNPSYEVAVLGLCEDLGSGNQLSKFYSGTGYATTFNLFGDCYTQSRESRIGGFTGLSDTTNENQMTLIWFDNTGRLSPIDLIGQRTIENEVRWSNTGILNTNDNNISKFDAPDYKLTDIRAGGINMLYAQIGDGSRNDALLIICKSNGYITLLQQAFIRSADNAGTVTTTGNFIENINDLNGKPGTECPRSFAGYNGVVMWVDTVQRCVQVYDRGATYKASDIKTKRVFEAIIKKCVAQGLQEYITGGMNPFSNEYIVSFPDSTPLSKPNLPTTTLEFPFDFFYEKVYSWVYNFSLKRWTSIFQTGRWYMNVAKDVFSWSGSAFYQEYLNSSENPEFDGLVAIPFNSNYPNIKSPLSLQIDATRAPDQTWLYVDTTSYINPTTTGVYSVMVAGIQDWQYREGQWFSAVLRDRLSNNATSLTWEAEGLRGHRLKGKVIQVVMVWLKTGGRFEVTSAALTYE